MGLTGQERRRLIRLISNEKQRRLQAQIQHSKDHCKGCGTPHNEPMTGCPHCRDREKSRRRRQQNSVPCATQGCPSRVFPWSSPNRPAHKGYCLECTKQRKRGDR